MQQVQEYIRALMKVGNLNENEAKSLVYYSTMTWSDEPTIRPIVNLNGETATGKSGIMRQMLPWCCESKWVNARNMTSAQLRDELADVKTAFVEEADKAKNPEEAENWYQQRYDESGRELRYRRQTVNNRGSRNINQMETHCHSGHTVLHTQGEFTSCQMERRTLRININKDSSRLYTTTRGLSGEPLAQIAKEVDWDAPIQQDASNSAWDVYLLLMRVAAHLGDDDYLAYAKEQIALKTEADNDSKTFEPKGVVLSEIATLYKEALGQGRGHVAITSVTQRVKDRGYLYNERQVTGNARVLGFGIVRPHNKAHIRVVSKEELLDIAARMGLERELFEEIDTPLMKSKRIPYAS